MLLNECLGGLASFLSRADKGRDFHLSLRVPPFYDDDGSLVGIISITSQTAGYMNPRTTSRRKKMKRALSLQGLVLPHPIQFAIASKLSNKVRSKMRAGDTSVTLSEGGSGDSHHGVFGATLSDHRDDAASSGATTPRGDIIHAPFVVFTCNGERPFKDSSDGKYAIQKVFTSKAEEWMAYGVTPESNNEDSSMWSSSINAYCLEYDLLWDDLTIGQHIGQGSRGTVYHGLWFGSDLAVKLFSKQECSEEVMQSFRQEWKSLPSTAEKYARGGLETAYPDCLGHCEYWVTRLFIRHRQWVEPCFAGVLMCQSSNEAYDGEDVSSLQWFKSSGEVHGIRSPSRDIQTLYEAKNLVVNVDWSSPLGPCRWKWNVH
ncbi:unnamed protein product [Arabis nemorensis]|uniref:Protein kinase domain-containing protein n=1 Tax=Arabis nemorensis TaxID=586526 RepID=A0A565B5Z1_9BRAS|nr:unnamed protein product [Arabis nemorensis]